MSNFSVRAIGVIRSDLKRREDAPRQGPEGAPDAWLEIEPQFAEALLPARPNPLGLHPVTVREIDRTRLKIGPIEAFDGTPVVDIKSASTRANG
jgi:tRNA (Thr-GGU) A37 N-methylase